MCVLPYQHFKGMLSNTKKVYLWKFIQLVLPDDKSKKGIVEKVLISVKGGSAATAIAMKTQLTKDNVLDINRYIAWAETLSHLPALIYSDVRMHLNPSSR